MSRRTAVRAGVFDHVIAHVSGEVCVDLLMTPPGTRIRRRTRRRPSGRRRRSRAAGLSIPLGPRSRIPIPAP